MSYSVAPQERDRIRMALGAQGARLLAMVVGQGVKWLRRRGHWVVGAFV